MKYLKYDIKDMSISRTLGDKTNLISGAVNYFGLQFNFDEDFASIPGVKSVEFCKQRQCKRVDLVDGKCAIPNEILQDKQSFEIRVTSGRTVATPWTNVGIVESGSILPDEPEEVPATMEYVKTESGDNSAPLLRVNDDGILEYSRDGIEWFKGINGVPEVPVKPEGKVYGRSNGDWVDLDTLQKELMGIEVVKVNGTPVDVAEKTVNIDLSAYAKTEDIDLTPYATADDLKQLSVLKGETSTLTTISDSETDTMAIVSKINEIVAVLQVRGIVSA